MIDRRTLIKGAGALAASASPLQALAQTITMPFGNGERPLVKYPQKRPMIGVTSRPPHLETPFAVFNESVLTPNATVPINRLNVRSFITSLAEGAKVAAGAQTLQGIAFDGGSGIKDVSVSIDGGASWAATTLGQNLGKYSFRPWTLPVTLPAGPQVLKVRATANDGKVQPAEPRWNPSGYMRNVVETLRVTAA